MRMPQKKRRSGRIALTVAPSVVFASTSKQTAKQTETDGEMETDCPVYHWMSAHSSILYLKNDELQALATEHQPVVSFH
jgi:hypothetical protein